MSKTTPVLPPIPQSYVGTNPFSVKALIAWRDECVRINCVDLSDLRRIAWLIGNIFVHGNFVAETLNECELEKLLRKVGCFWSSLKDFDASYERKSGNTHE